MRMKKGREFGKTAEADMTPMIDMTFQLIAFFMILISFSKAEQNDAIKLPLSELANPPADKIVKFITLHIDRETIKQDNVVKSKIYFGGREFNLEETGAKSIKLALIQRARVYADDGVEKDKVLVIIRADRYTQTGMVQELIRICKDKKINFEKFALRARKPR